MQFSSLLKRKFREADWFLVAANLLPVYGVWFMKWNAREIFLVYCLETIIIGFFTLIKLGIVTTIRKKGLWENYGSRTMVPGIYFIVFFLLHYGLFVSIQTSLFLGIISMHEDYTPSILHLIFHPFQYLDRNGWLLFCAFVFSYGYENLYGFISKNEFRTKSFERIMFEPYLRIFIQQFAVTTGAFFVVFGVSKVFILAFAIVKIFFTVCLDYETAIQKAGEKVKLYQESNSSHS
jgi:hypothetical protein